jgi:hypothetical protein
MPKTAGIQGTNARDASERRTSGKDEQRRVERGRKKKGSSDEATSGIAECLTYLIGAD